MKPLAEFHEQVDALRRIYSSLIDADVQGAPLESLRALVQGLTQSARARSRYFWCWRCRHVRAMDSALPLDPAEAAPEPGTFRTVPDDLSTIVREERSACRVCLPDGYGEECDVCGACGLPLERQLLRNAARCRRCRETVESCRRLSFDRCRCGACAVDGGLEYVRRVGSPDCIEELSIWSRACSCHSDPGDNQYPEEQKERPGQDLNLGSLH